MNRMEKLRLTGGADPQNRRSHSRCRPKNIATPFSETGAPLGSLPGYLSSRGAFPKSRANDCGLNASRCSKCANIQRLDAIRLYGPIAFWMDVGQTLLGDGCQIRTGRHEEEGFRPDFRGQIAKPFWAESADLRTSRKLPDTTK